MTKIKFMRHFNCRYEERGKLAVNLDRGQSAVNLKKESINLPWFFTNPLSLKKRKGMERENYVKGTSGWGLRMKNVGRENVLLSVYWLVLSLYITFKRGIAFAGGPIPLEYDSFGEWVSLKVGNALLAKFLSGCINYLDSHFPTLFSRALGGQTHAHCHVLHLPILESFPNINNNPNQWSWLVP